MEKCNLALASAESFFSAMSSWGLKCRNQVEHFEIISHFYKKIINFKNQSVLPSKDFIVCSEKNVMDGRVPGNPVKDNFFGQDWKFWICLGD